LWKLPQRLLEQARRRAPYRDCLLRVPTAVRDGVGGLETMRCAPLTPIRAWGSFPFLGGFRSENPIANPVREVETTDFLLGCVTPVRRRHSTDQNPVHAREDAGRLPARQRKRASRPAPPRSAARPFAGASQLPTSRCFLGHVGVGVHTIRERSDDQESRIPRVMRRREARMPARRAKASVQPDGPIGPSGLVPNRAVS